MAAPDRMAAASTENDTELFDNVSGAYDNPYMTNAYQRKNGEILFLGEDVWHTKVRIHRISSPVTSPSVVGGLSIPSYETLFAQPWMGQKKISIPFTSTILFEANASTLDGYITKVEFFYRDISDVTKVNPLEVKIGEDLNGADGWKVNWLTTALSISGQYVIYTKAYTSTSSVTSTSGHIKVNFSNVTGLDDASVQSKMNVFPNPFSNTIKLSSDSRWVLYDMKGIELKKGFGSTIETESLDKGVYMLHLSDESVHKMVKMDN